MSFVTADEFSVKVTKSYFKDWCLMNSQSKLNELFSVSCNLFCASFLVTPCLVVAVQTVQPCSASGTTKL